MWLYVAVLAALCLLTFFPGLDSHGVTNWQEGQRLIVARDMQSRGEWIIPTVSGRPYIAKPPMIYWAQMALANLLGQTVELWHLRFVAALAGLLGVLATFFASRELLTPDRPAPDQKALADRAACWSAALLATGILYVRASRIGELDILMVPFIAAAVWAVARAFRTHRLQRRADWPAVLLATFFATGAVLTKDPGLLYVALAAYGGIAVWYAWTTQPLDLALLPRRVREPLVFAPAAPAGLAIGGGLIVGLAFFLAAARNLDDLGDLPGPLLIGLAGAWLGATLARLLTPRRFFAFFVALSRTHPVIVIGVPAAARFGWGWLIANRVGIEKAAELAKFEVDDNVRPFIAEAPVNNFETLLFGLGLGSALAIVAAICLLRWRPRLTPGAAIVAAWIMLSLIAFSILGKGVQRYLTPMWPAWAMLAGWLCAVWCRPRPLRIAPAPFLAAAILLLGIAQSFQYGFLRDKLNSARSPRDFIHAISQRDAFPGFDRLCSFEYTSPAMDYYAGRPVQIVGDPRAGITMLAGTTQSLEQFAAEVRTAGPAVLIFRDGPIPGVDLPLAAERLRSLGLQVEDLPHLPPFRIDNGRTGVKAAIVSAAAPARLR